MAKKKRENEKDLTLDDFYFCETEKDLKESLKEIEKDKMKGKIIITKDLELKDTISLGEGYYFFEAGGEKGKVKLSIKDKEKAILDATKVEKCVVRGFEIDSRRIKKLENVKIEERDKEKDKEKTGKKGEKKESKKGTGEKEGGERGEDKEPEEKEKKKEKEEKKGKEAEEEEKGEEGKKEGGNKIYYVEDLELNDIKEFINETKKDGVRDFKKVVFKDKRKKRRDFCKVALTDEKHKHKFRDWDKDTFLKKKKIKVTMTLAVEFIT